MSSAGAVSFDYESDMRLISKKKYIPIQDFQREQGVGSKTGKRILNLIENMWA